MVTETATATKMTMVTASITMLTQTPSVSDADLMVSMLSECCVNFGRKIFPPENKCVRPSINTSQVGIVHCGSRHICAWYATGC
jgi:hypothetical protein